MNQTLTYIPKKTQERRILDVLERNIGKWVSGEYFLREMLLSQYHARIWGLQKKGCHIVASEFTSEHGFKSYKLIPKDTLF